MNPASTSRYTATAIVLHWVLGLALLASFGLGLYMAELSISPWRLKLYNWHKWAGMIILVLSALRLVWRLAHRPPAELPGPAWQTGAARAMHALLYLLFFAVPLFGWAYSSAAGFPIVVFGVLPLPDLVPTDKALADAIKPWHEGLAWTMVLLVLVHAAAALKHHFIDRDGVLSRMWIDKHRIASHEDFP